MNGALDPAEPLQNGLKRNAMHYAAFRHYWVARAMSSFAIQITSVSVGWMIYDITRSAFMLGLVGLVQFLPSLLLILITGQTADRYPRRNIMISCSLLEALSIILILSFFITGNISPLPIFLALGLFGISRAFFGPAVQALMANVVPPIALPSAISWSTSVWQIGTIAGPAVGGLLYGLGAEAAFGMALALFFLAALFSRLVPRGIVAPTSDMGRSKLQEAFSGFDFVRSQPIILGAISLDLFVVLLGGATALLPVVAVEILQAGPWALGLLRASAGVGGIGMGLWLAQFPIRRRTGPILLVSTAVFGLATIAFGLSHSIALSIVSLIIIGASDMISVYVRSSVIQLLTPDHIRGRVSALNMIFIGASNELGEFRAGSVASLTGTITAIVIGGIGSIAVAGLWGRFFPALRQLGALDQVKPDENSTK